MKIHDSFSEIPHFYMTENGHIYVYIHINIYIVLYLIMVHFLKNFTSHAYFIHLELRIIHTNIHSVFLIFIK